MPSVHKQASTPGSGRTPAPLRREDVWAGLSLMQTVYTVALVLGLETVVNASYTLVFSPTSGPSVRSPGYLGLILATIFLLAIRFFWVPRNLNSYIINFYDERGEGVFTRMTTVHFPIALAHALIFYYICQVFLDMTHADGGIGSGEMTDFLTRFVALYGGLLLLNALWLWRITPRAAGSSHPGKIWANNNFIFVCVTLIVLGAFKAFDLSNSTFIILACLAFIANSVIDLWRASKFYILYEQ